MTTFDAKQYVRDFERAWNDKNAQTFLSKYYDANVEFTDPSGKLQRGIDPLRNVLQTWFKGFGEMKIDVTQAIQNGNDVAILQRCKGRNTGELEMVPGEPLAATNKNAEVEVAEFIKLNAQGKIVRDVTILDSASLLMQLGHLPGPTSQSKMTGRAAQR